MDSLSSSLEPDRQHPQGHLNPLNDLLAAVPRKTKEQHQPGDPRMNIETLISHLQELIDAGLDPRTMVYVREKTNLNGDGWVSPRTVTTGYDPHPLSAANDGTLVVYVS